MTNINHTHAKMGSRLTQVKQRLIGLFRVEGPLRLGDAQEFVAHHPSPKKKRGVYYEASLNRVHVAKKLLYQTHVGYARQPLGEKAVRNSSGMARCLHQKLVVGISCRNFRISRSQ
jgi:hypothetical protein